MLDKIQSNCLKIVQEKFFFLNILTSFKIYCLFTLWSKKVDTDQQLYYYTYTAPLLLLCVWLFGPLWESPFGLATLWSRFPFSFFLQKNPLSRRKKSTRNVPRDWPFEMSISSMEMSFLFFSSLYIRVR